METSCNVDPAIVAFRASFRAWYEGPDGLESQSGPPDLYRELPRQPRDRPCVACVSADAALRRFAPMVLRAAEYSARADQLAQLPRIETPADADDAAQHVDALAWDFDDRTDAQMAAREAIGEMRRAIDVAASDPENREAEVSEVDGWCFTFEGFEQLRDPAMEILRLAVRTGLPKQRAVDDGLAHLQRLIRRAHGEPLD